MQQCPVPGMADETYLCSVTACEDVNNSDIVGEESIESDGGSKEPHGLMLCWQSSACSICRR